MPPKYHHPAEFRLSEIAWLIEGRSAEDLGMMLDRTTRASARSKWGAVVKAGGFTVDEADLFAVRAGYHPALLWANWHGRALALDARHREWREELRQQTAARSAASRKARRSRARLQLVTGGSE